MSDLLQRLVQTARGTTQANRLRIEPVLASRYAGKPGASNFSPQELNVELPAPRSPHSATATHAPSPPSKIAAPAAPDINASVALPARDDSNESSAEPRQPKAFDAIATRSTDTVASVPIDDALSTQAAPAATVRAETTITTHHSITTRAAPNAPQASPRAIKAATKPNAPVAPAVIAAPSVPVEQSQSITISIGHVEVRNVAAPAPAAARRPAFRPGVSLDAFLRRGSDER